MQKPVLIWTQIKYLGLVSKLVDESQYTSFSTVLDQKIMIVQKVADWDSFSYGVSDI